MHARIGCVIFALVFASRAQAQVPACLKQLATPVYPPLAKQARVQGEVILNFSVDANGQPTGIAAEGHKLLVGAATRTAEGVVFERSACAGQKFTVRYQFAIDDSVKPGAVFVPPSGFRITVQSEPISHGQAGLPTACVQGEAFVVFYLNADGAIQRSEQSGHKLLAEGVLLQARDTVFDPRPCNTRVPVSVKFQLKDPQSHDGKSTVVLVEPGFLAVTAHKPAPTFD